MIKSNGDEPYQSNALHPNELGLGLGRAKSRNTAKIDVSYSGTYARKGDILIPRVENDFGVQ